MKEKYTQFASVALAVVALFLSVVALMQVDNTPAANQPQARGTTYFGNLSASGTLNADGATTLNSTLDVDGNVSSGTGSFTVTDSANITGAVDCDSTFNADGAATFNSTVDIDGNITSGTGGITLADTVNATGAVDFDSTLNVDGASTLNGAATVNNNLIVTGTGRVDGAVNLNSTVDIDGNISSGTGAVTITDNILVDGQSDAIQLLVQGNGTQTSDLFVCEQSDGTDKLTLNNYGQALFSSEADADAANYDYMVAIEYAMTGVTTKDRNYGLYIEGTRAAGQEIGVGDHDEAGLKIRVDTEAVTTTAGTVLRGYDVEAKADNPGGTVTNLFGGLVTAKSDTSAGDVGVMVALSANTQNNAAVNDYLASGDFRIMRQAATEPTEEYGIEVRSSSTTGSGADAAIFVNSDYVGSLTTDSWDYGIDFDSAAINTADIRFENGTTLSENTDTVLTFSEFIGGAEQTALVIGAGETITPTGTFQPISSAAPVTTSTTVPIAVGARDGQLLILQNVNAADAITIDGTGGTVECKADIVLGTMDTVTLVSNGSIWYCLSVYDNS